jgi:prevent-host-death family protein
MITMTATEASRHFSALLDRVEAGESVKITRDGRAVCTVVPEQPHTWGALVAALHDLPPRDPDFARDLQEAYEYARSLTQEDPWDNA